MKTHCPKLNSFIPTYTSGISRPFNISACGKVIPTQLLSINTGKLTCKISRKTTDLLKM